MIDNSNLLFGWYRSVFADAVRNTIRFDVLKPMDMMRLDGQVVFTSDGLVRGAMGGGAYARPLGPSIACRLHTTRVVLDNLLDIDWEWNRFSICIRDHLHGLLGEVKR